MGQMAQRVAEYLRWDWLKLRFTQSNGQSGSPKSIIRRQANLNVSELVQPGYMATTANLLYFELLDVSIIELETKKSLRITWVGAHNKEEVRSLPTPFYSSSEADPSERARAPTLSCCQRTRR